MKEYKSNSEHYFEDENGLKQGEYKKYYSNGQLWFHCYFKNNNIHGEYKEYYSGGQLWVHCYYKDNNRHGEYKRYYKDGSLNYIKYYSNDKDITDMYNKLKKWKSL